MRALVWGALLGVLLLSGNWARAAGNVWQSFELPAAQSRYGQHYMVYLPDGYAAEPERKWPLLVFLHGRGEWGNDLALVRRQGLPRYLSKGNRLDAIVVAPQSPQGQYWHPLFVDAVMKDTAGRFRVDEQRTYLTGLSMGGVGSWSMALAFPERFAAVAPIAGCLMNDAATLESGLDPVAASDYLPYLQALRGVPVWVFHGDRDTVVDTELGKRSTTLLREAGGDVRETIYSMTDHDSWTPTYFDNPEFYPWLFSQRRPAARWDAPRPVLQMERYVGDYVDDTGAVRAKVREDGSRLLVTWTGVGVEEELLALSPTRFIGTGLVSFDEDGAGHMRSISYLGMGKARWKAAN